MPLILFLLLLIFLPPTLSQPSSDLRSLLEFKKGISTDPTGLVTASWSEAVTGSAGCPRGWKGVTCDPAGAAVVGVDLDGLGLAGELKFSTLATMASLQTLTLAGNQLSGRLVPSLGSVSSLQRLDLSGNKFYGPIPARVSDLYNLVHLNLLQLLRGRFPDRDPESAAAQGS